MGEVWPKSDDLKFHQTLRRAGSEFCPLAVTSRHTHGEILKEDMSSCCASFFRLEGWTQRVGQRTTSCVTSHSIDPFSPGSGDRKSKWSRQGQAPSGCSRQEAGLCLFQLLLAAGSPWLVSVQSLPCAHTSSSVSVNTFSISLFYLFIYLKLKRKIGCAGSSLWLLSLLPWSMWDLSSSIRDLTHIHCIGKQILNHWTTREVPSASIL